MRIPIGTAGCGSCANCCRSRIAGYANAAKQTFYDSFLKRAGLTWAEVMAP